jgi:hypothetical protein
MRRIRSQDSKHLQIAVGAGFTAPARAEFSQNHPKVENVLDKTNVFNLGDSMDQKPDIKEVIRYASVNAWAFLEKIAADMPREVKEDLVGSVSETMVKIYDSIDGSRGWPSYVYEKMRGTILDEMGRGLTADMPGIRRLKREEKADNEAGEKKWRRPQGFTRRVMLFDRDGEALQEDRILGANGVFSRFDPAAGSIRWDIVAKMARTDDFLHAYALHLRDYENDEIGRVFRLCPARIGQMLAAFIERFDSPKLINDPWLYQTIYAFGLASALGIEDCDASEIFGHSLGWEKQEPVDLDPGELRQVMVDGELTTIIDPDTIKAKYEAEAQAQKDLLGGVSVVFTREDALRAVQIEVSAKQNILKVLNDRPQQPPPEQMSLI